MAEGWDSNPASPLTARKLLILRCAPVATIAPTARVGYSFGTHTSNSRGVPAWCTRGSLPVRLTEVLVTTTTDRDTLGLLRVIPLGHQSEHHGSCATCGLHLWREGGYRLPGLKGLFCSLVCIECGIAEKTGQKKRSFGAPIGSGVRLLLYLKTAAPGIYAQTRARWPGFRPEAVFGVWNSAQWKAGRCRFLQPYSHDALP